MCVHGRASVCVCILVSRDIKQNCQKKKHISIKFCSNVGVDHKISRNKHELRFVVCLS